MLMPIATLIATTVLAVTHLAAGQLRWLEHLPRSRWLSFAGGVSVAYVFVHILPDLSERQTTFQETGVLGFLEHHVYLMALLGLAVFYGLERAAKMSHQRHRQAGEDDPQAPGVFWLHLASFGLYNALIGYLLTQRDDPDVMELALFTCALGLHFVVNDFGLRDHYKGRYDRIGRWLLAAGPLLGWGIGQVAAIAPAALALLFAFLAGGIVLNVLKEELPEERASRFWPFVLGMGGYAALLVTL